MRNPTEWCGCLEKINYARCLANTSYRWTPRPAVSSLRSAAPASAHHTEAELDPANAYARAALYVLGVEQPEHDHVN